MRRHHAMAKMIFPQRGMLILKKETSNPPKRQAFFFPSEIAINIISQYQHKACSAPAAYLFDLEMQSLTPVRMDVIDLHVNLRISVTQWQWIKYSCTAKSFNLLLLH